MNSTLGSRWTVSGCFFYANYSLFSVKMTQKQYFRIGILDVSDFERYNKNSKLII